MGKTTNKQAIRAFVERWKSAECNEDREARSFLIEFLGDVLGIENPTRIIDFERRVKGRKIDAFYEDMGILIEAKSRKPGILDEQRNNGKYGFETPYQQAKWYANELPNSITPRWIIVTSFDEFRIHDLELEYPERDYVSVKLEDLPDQAYLFDFFFDKSQSRLVKEKKLSVEAGEIVGRLYDAFAKQYKNLDESAEEQRSLNVLIVRLVFLLYAEDAGLFNGHQAFYKYMKGFNAEQSRVALLDLFKVLDTPEDKRDPYASEKLLEFPYVNGSLFADGTIIVPQFTEDLRVELLLNASCGFNWKDISPTIFGAVFESTLNPETRRAGGMHYTSIENIHKVIDPLFLDDLKAELAEIEGEKVERKRMFALRAFQQKLASLNIFDPACGSGNFLTESYIQLRRLENRVLESIQGEGQASLGFDGDADPVKVSIKQFYGIEINDFAVSVAKTALWIAESQMLTETQDIVSRYIDYFPLTTNAHIVEGNALRMDWNDVLPAEKCSYIIGNPPFVGFKFATTSQKEDMRSLFGQQAKLLDYVCGWYKKAASYIQGQQIHVAFVSTNSVSQGKMAADLWSVLMGQDGIVINFAYRTFVWNNEASGQAHVHCVIIGFSTTQAAVKEKRLYRAEVGMHAAHINAYLLDQPDVFILSRSKPICDVPEMVMGNQAMDNGNLIIEAKNYEAFVQAEPNAARYIKRYMMGNEFINNKERWCLWLDGCSQETIDSMPLVRERVENVRRFRAASNDAGARKKAETPHLFREQRNPVRFVAIPIVSSERRSYVPMGFLDDEVIAGNKLFMLPDADLYHFGVLSSSIHNAWLRAVGARLKSDYTYSKDIVYNNFIWPEPTPEQKQAIEQAAQAVLDAREAHPGWSLAQLYDPDKMPADLLKAHKTLDTAVEAAYGVNFHGDEEKIVAHLFKLYAEATATSK
ncbi:DNA methyltransferase [Adlercreutzia sp. ZJ138]|uniref:DNA methyltransferase n=1 Tax=Adlercreutzia sp. ZJ138 TaxID=2709405 RepID=UPI0013EA13B3|nr:DNA methyltransferase [Adlercreutzia sp. ZJ138]